MSYSKRRRIHTSEGKDLSHVGFSLAESDQLLLREFMEREGFASPAAACRALVLSGIERWPTFGITVAERRTAAMSFKVKAFAAIGIAIKQLEADLEDELRVDRDATAIGETKRAVVNLEMERTTR